MKKIENYETRRGKSRHIEVKIQCEMCEADTWVKWTRVKNGLGRFCGKSCFHDYQREEGKKTRGEENVKFHLDKSRNVWLAYWEEEDTGKRKNTTKARWLWENNKGEIPPKYVVTYIDGNPENCELDNLKIVSRVEFNSTSLMGHRVTDEGRANMSKSAKTKDFSVAHRRNIGKATKRMWEDGLFDGVHKGEHNSDWKGGIKPYPMEFNEKLRAKIRRRDDHKCQCCRKGLYRSRHGHVHHIDSDKTNNSEDNLVLLCQSCHGAVHGRNNVSDRIEELKGELK